MFNFTGYIYAYRIFDIGHEVDLKAAQHNLNSAANSDSFGFKRSLKSVVIEEKPLSFLLENINFEFEDHTYETKVVSKLWSFGALSICFQISIDKPLSEKQLLDLSIYLNNNDFLDTLAKEKVLDLMGEIKSSIKKPDLWSQSEEYVIFIDTMSLEKQTPEKVDKLIQGEFLYKLLSFEKTDNLSQQMKAPIVQNTIQYSNNDLIAIDWDSSYVISQNDSQDICDVIEFANIQLLELRYFDNLLDKEINNLFKEIMLTSPGVFNQTYQRLNRDATRLYLETLEVVERVENSLKVIGDIYYARVYRSALLRLKINDWRATIDRKLKSILDVCEMNKAEIEGKRSLVLEMIIIVLIAIEVIPFLYKLL
jgi:hypothetical protein